MGRPAFSPAQTEVIRATAKRIWETRYKGLKQKRGSGEPGGQEAMAVALNIAQQTLSGIITGKYAAGIAVARAIANLDGKTLESLLGETFVEEEAAAERDAQGFANLTTCIDFYATTKTWSPWTIAAARAGVCGSVDLPAPSWAKRLDVLEDTLTRYRRLAEPTWAETADLHLVTR